MNKKIEKKLNKLALDTTGYDICDIESFNTAEEAIISHLDWLEFHYIDIRQNFESETRKLREE